MDLVVMNIFTINKICTAILISCSLTSVAIQAEPQTAPERKMAPNSAHGKNFDDAIDSYKKQLKQRTQNIYPGFENLPSYDAEETYTDKGNKVVFTENGRFGVFENEYWTKGDLPNFELIKSAWILVAETDANGYVLDASATLNPWNEAETYNTGDQVKYMIDGKTYQFSAKQWSKGKPPVLTKQYGGTAEEWESEWEMMNNGNFIPDDGTIEPPVKPDPETPDPETPDPETPDPETPDPETPDPETPDPEKPNYAKWDSASIYEKPDRVSHVINGVTYIFEAKYWVQGVAPFLTQSHGGTGEDFDTPWQILSDTDTGNPDTGNPDTGNPDIENPEVTPGEPDVEMPEGEYEFLSAVDSENWNWFFPLRSGKYDPSGSTRNAPPIAMPDGSTDVYTLGAFKKAVMEYNTWAEKNNYKQFLNEGTMSQQAHEFIAFWAKSARETSGSWANAPAPWIENDSVAGQVWKGALYWIEEQNRTTNADGTSPVIEYVDSNSPYTPEQGRSYYGRGIIQLSWNYNYGQFSEWLFNNGMMKDIITEKDTLLKRPDYVATHSELAYLSGIWFWMTPQGPKPSSHDVMYGNVYNVSTSSSDQGLPPRNDGGAVPAASGESKEQDVIAYRLGTVINIVNGGLECNTQAATHSGPMQRVSYYNAYAKYINAQIEGVNVTVIDDATNVWNQFVSPSSPENLKTATCYSMKSYYGW